ncbi:MAG TPA: hypothetical protein VMV99_14525 [Rhodanobacter sp.]|nr:hypothetical protein [Rhodanobacter sp.]
MSFCEAMRELNQYEVTEVTGCGYAPLYAAEALGATSMGVIAGVVSSAVLTPAGGVLVGIAVSDVIGLGFVGINSLLGM